MNFFFTPLGSEGAHGSNFAFPLSLTCLNVVALSHFLRGWKLASLIKTEISDPENLKINIFNFFQELLKREQNKK